MQFHVNLDDWNDWISTWWCCWLWHACSGYFTGLSTPIWSWQSPHFRDSAFADIRFSYLPIRMVRTWRFCVPHLSRADTSGIGELVSVEWDFRTQIRWSFQSVSGSAKSRWDGTLSNSLAHRSGTAADLDVSPLPRKKCGCFVHWSQDAISVCSALFELFWRAINFWNESVREVGWERI